MITVSRRRFPADHERHRRRRRDDGHLGGLPRRGCQRRPIAIVGRRRAGRGSGIRKVPTYCDICFWKCGAIAYVRDGRLWKIEGNPEDPLSRGRLCPRGTGGVGAHFDPDRLKYPLIRRQKRGQEEWAQVSWDTALNRVAEKMQQIKAAHGPEAVALVLSRHRRHLPQAHAAGVRHAEHGGTVVCAVPRAARRRLRADLRRRGRVARADRHPQRALPRAHRLAPRREHAQHAGAGVRRGGWRRRVGHRRRPALLDCREQGEVLPSDQARHRPRAHPRLDERRRLRGAVRHGVRRRRTASASTRSRRRWRPARPEWAYPETGIEPGPDSRDGARDGALPARDARPSRTARDLVRRRHTAQPRAGAAQRADGELGAEGRILDAGADGRRPATRTRRTRAPARGKVDNPDGKYPFATEAITTGIREATLTGQPYPVKGWMVYATNLLHAMPEPGGDDPRHQGARPAGRGRCHPERDGRLGRRRAA